MSAGKCICGLPGTSYDGPGMSVCPECGCEHDTAACAAIAADCDCCRAIAKEEGQ